MAIKRILFVMQSLYDGGAEKLLVDMLNNFDYSKYDIDLLLEHDFWKLCKSSAFRSEKK